MRRLSQKVGTWGSGRIEIETAAALPGSHVTPALHEPAVRYRCQSWVHRRTQFAVLLVALWRGSRRSIVGARLMTLPTAIKAGRRSRRVGSVSPCREGLAPVAEWLWSSAAASPSAPATNNFPAASRLLAPIKIAGCGPGAELRSPAPSAGLRLALPARVDRPSQRGEAPNDGERDDPALRTHLRLAVSPTSRKSART